MGGTPPRDPELEFDKRLGGRYWLMELGCCPTSSTWTALRAQRCKPGWAVVRLSDRMAFLSEIAPERAMKRMAISLPSAAAAVLALLPGTAARAAGPGGYAVTA